MRNESADQILTRIEALETEIAKDRQAFHANPPASEAALRHQKEFNDHVTRLIAQYKLLKQTPPVIQPITVKPAEPSARLSTSPHSLLNTSLPVTPSATNAVVYEITIPNDEKFDPNKAIKFVGQILRDQGKNFAFRIAASPDRKVSFQVLDFDINDNRPSISISVKGIYPKANIDTLPFTPIPFTESTRYHGIMPLIHIGAAHGDEKRFLAAPTPNETGGATVAYIAHTIAEAANQGASVNLNIFAVRRAPYTEERRQEAIRKLLGLPSNSQKILRDIINVTVSVAAFTVDEATEHKGKRDYSPIIPAHQPPQPDDWQKRAVTKAKEQELYETIIILEIAAPTEEVGVLTANTIKDHLVNTGLFDFGYYGFGFPKAVGDTHPIQQITHQNDPKFVSLAKFISFLNNNPPIKTAYTSYLTIPEVAGLFHLPFAGMDERLIDFASDNKPAKAILENRDGIEIGIANKLPVRLPDRSRYDHINIIGKTGVGKSTLMLDMVRQDIARGKGVGVIDPDGKLVNDILKTAIPDNRVDDVIVLDLAETTYPAPLNPLNIRDSHGQITSGLFADMVRRIYPEFDKAERARSFLMGALGALNLVNNPTIADAVKLFEDQEFLIETISGNELKLDKGTYRFWASYAGLTRANKRDYPYPVVHRLNSLISLDVLHPILCHPETLDWNRAMRDNRIILVSLNPHSDAVGDQEQSLLGTIVLSMILSTARNHGEVKPFDFYLYIDEVQRFINTPLDKFFEGIRKFGVYLTVANQFLGQLETGVLEAIIGNVGGTFVFEVGDSDAGKLERATAPAFNRAQLMNLGKFHPVLRMKIDGQSYPAFDLQTKPPLRVTDEASAKARATVIRKRSIEKWTPTTRDSIIEELDKRHAQTPIVFDTGDADDRGKRPKAKKIDPAPETPKPEIKNDNEDWDKWADDPKT